MTPEISVESADGGRASILRIRAQPGARREGVAGAWNGHLRLALRAPALEGRANEALLALLARLFEVRASSIELLQGATSRSKRVRLPLAPDETRARLGRLLPPT